MYGVQTIALSIVASHILLKQKNAIETCSDNDVKETWPTNIAGYYVTIGPSKVQAETTYADIQ